MERYAGFAGNGEASAAFTELGGMGELVEFGGTERIFTNPSEKKTEDYVTGKFG